MTFLQLLSSGILAVSLLASTAYSQVAVYTIPVDGLNLKYYYRVNMGQENNGEPIVVVLTEKDKVDIANLTVQKLIELLEKNGGGDAQPDELAGKFWGILERECKSCHTDPAAKKGFGMFAENGGPKSLTYAQVDEIFEQVDTQAMPPDTEKLSVQDVQIIRDMRNLLRKTELEAQTKKEKEGDK